MPETQLVHLVWAPLGIEPLERFLAAYAGHDPGRPHRLTVILNGFASPAAAAPHRALLREVDHDVLVPRRPLQDLAAYAAAARRMQGPVACFANSYARPLVDGWLELLCDPLEGPEVGLAGTTGTYESHLASVARGGLRSPRVAADLVRHAPFFAPFPAPSVRTGVFAIDPRRLAAAAPRRMRSKFAAHAFESGRRGLTARVRRAGLRPVVAGRDGRAYEIAEWPDSATFRAGGQRNLLVADNRTDEWERADSALRRELTLMAWGRIPD
jgi:hypothetical protein